MAQTSDRWFEVVGGAEVVKFFAVIVDLRKVNNKVSVKTKLGLLSDRDQKEPIDVKNGK